jgi:hypothetical protein
LNFFEIKNNRKQVKTEKGKSKKFFAVLFGRGKTVRK